MNRATATTTTKNARKKKLQISSHCVSVCVCVSQRARNSIKCYIATLCTELAGGSRLATVRDKPYSLLNIQNINSRFMSLIWCVCVCVLCLFSFIHFIWCCPSSLAAATAPPCVCVCVCKILSDASVKSHARRDAKFACDFSCANCDAATAAATTAAAACCFRQCEKQRRRCAHVWVCACMSQRRTFIIIHAILLWSRNETHEKTKPTKIIIFCTHCAKLRRIAAAAAVWRLQPRLYSLHASRASTHTHLLRNWDLFLI